MVIEESNALLHLTGPVGIAREFYVGLAQIGAGQMNTVIESMNAREVLETLPSALEAIRLLAVYKTHVSQGESTEIVVMTLNEWMQNTVSDPYVLLVAGMIYGSEEKYSDAFSALQREPGGSTIECGAAVVQLYLKMERVELAEKAAQKMVKMEEDATLTHIALAWVYLAMGGDKCDEAALLFQELGERFGPTPLLLNGGAVAHMMMFNFEESARLLAQAKDDHPQNVGTMINAVALARHQGACEEQVDVLMTNIRNAAPTHPWIENVDNLSVNFDRLATTFA